MPVVCSQLRLEGLVAFFDDGAIGMEQSLARPLSARAQGGRLIRRVLSQGAQHILALWHRNVLDGDARGGLCQRAEEVVAAKGALHK